MHSIVIPGSDRPAIPQKSYRLRQVLAQAAASEAAVDLIRELALGPQPERPLTIPVVPRWAAAAMEAAHG